MIAKASSEPRLKLVAGFDRDLAWQNGGSVRYLVSDLTASGTASQTTEGTPLNLALCIDVSGSMQGGKLAAARATAAAVAQGLTERDRLTIVTFSDEATLVLDATPMDAEGRSEALRLIKRLRAEASTNLWEGWVLAGERLATAMRLDPRASHRILLLSDGHANVGTTDAGELALHCGQAQMNGILTSAVGIGDHYDELLLGAMTESGGGRLHDAEHATEISEVVLGELLEGRSALMERATLRIAIPDGVQRVEVVGAWSHTVTSDAVEILVGALRDGYVRRVVLRVICEAGEPDDTLAFTVSATALLADGSGSVDARRTRAVLTFAKGTVNTDQERHIERSLEVLSTWQADILRKAVDLNRKRDMRGARAYLMTEMQYIERYAQGLPASEELHGELVLLAMRITERLEPRMMKEVYMQSSKRTRGEGDYRSSPRVMSDVLRRKET